MIRPTHAASLLVPAFLAAAACTSGETPAPMPGETVRSELARETSPEVPEADREALRAGNTAFAAALHGQLRGQEGNLFYSPHSISTALAMTYAGARGDTETQMAAALGFDLPQAQLHPAFNWLDLELESRGEGAQGTDSEGFRLRVTNGLFGQTGYGFLPPFLDVLAINYDAGMSLLDFAAAPDPSRVAINDWVDDRTEGRIPELLAPGIITTDTRLVLVNAIYFNAAWRDPFDEDDTEDGTFAAPGGDVTVPMMQGEAGYGYAAGEAYEAVALPYDGDELDMVIVAPVAGTFDAFEAAVDGAALEAIFGALAPAELRLTMPRFELRFSASLVEPLQALGMVDAFTDAADLSGMDGTRSLAISDVVHQAFVKVDEKGTEAAAATAVVVGPTSVPDYQPVTIDRPFLFYVRDRATGAILFAGRIVDPS